MNTSAIIASLLVSAAVAMFLRTSSGEQFPVLHRVCLFVACLVVCGTVAVVIVPFTNFFVDGAEYLFNGFIRTFIPNP